jgi:hypothetical protein
VNTKIRTLVSMDIPSCVNLDREKFGVDSLTSCDITSYKDSQDTFCRVLSSKNLLSGYVIYCRVRTKLQVVRLVGKTIEDEAALIEYVVKKLTQSAIVDTVTFNVPETWLDTQLLLKNMGFKGKNVIKGKNFDSFHMELTAKNTISSEIKA